MKDSPTTDKEVSINIRIRPRKIVKGALLLLMFVAVFFIGRLTAESGGEAVASSATVASLEGAASPATTTAESTGKEEDSWTSKVSGLVTGLVTGLLPDFSDEEKEKKEKSTAEETATASTGTATEPAPAETAVAEAAPEVAANETAAPESAVGAEPAEIVITSYSKVAVALNDVVIEWKETWGKIVKIDYTLKNNEEGTIKPSYFILLVEGYDTEENMIRKKISLPLSGQSIKAGESYSQISNVPGGFAYNQLTAGDLADVRLTLQLYDASDRLMGTFNKGFDLRGNK